MPKKDDYELLKFFRLTLFNVWLRFLRTRLTFPINTGFSSCYRNFYSQNLETNVKFVNLLIWSNYISFNYGYMCASPPPIGITQYFCAGSPPFVNFVKRNFVNSYSSDIPMKFSIFNYKLSTEESTINYQS